jgi:protein-disulfide isomerase
MLERAADGGILEIGVDEAPVLTIFTNYSCDYCSQFMSRDFARLLREYVDIGRLKVRIVSVPLAKYKTSDGEAAALFCATSKARGKQMHDKLLATAKRDRAGLLALGTAVKLTTKEFGACMDAQTTKDQLAIQKTMIETNGITLVPSFMLGSAIQTGYPAYADLRGWIDAQLQ